MNQQKRGRLFKEAVEAGEVQPLVDEGMTALQISKRYNVSESTVVRHVKIQHKITKQENLALSKMTPARKLAMCGAWR